MVKKWHSPEVIINKLREAEILLNQGANVGEASRKIVVTFVPFPELLSEGFHPGLRSIQVYFLCCLASVRPRLRLLECLLK